MNIIGNYIYGSEDSTDIDIAYIVDELPSLQECKKFCSEDKNENRNLITINNGVITNCYKGTVDELNNAILDTYKLHEQNTELLINRKIERDIPLKLIRSIRAMLSHLSRSQYRKEIKLALRSNWTTRLETLDNIKLNTIDFDNINNNMSREDILKLFAFQIGQCRPLILSNTEYYTKREIMDDLAYNNMLKLYLKRIPYTLVDDLDYMMHVLITNIKYYFPYEDIDDNTVTFIKYEDPFNKNENIIKTTYDLKHEHQINIENNDV